MSTEITHLRGRLVAFLIQSTYELSLPPIVKYSALSLFFDRFRPSVVRFFKKKKAEIHWVLKPLTESNLQLFVLISIWISSKMHCNRGLSVHNLKSFGDKVITEQVFMVRDFLDAELVFLKLIHSLKTFLIKEVSKIGELLNFDACMDMMDLLYEKEETSLFINLQIFWLLPFWSLLT